MVSFSIFLSQYINFGKIASNKSRIWDFSMVDVVLINPPDIHSKYEEFLGLTAPPLGLGYIAAVLEKKDYNVAIIDAPRS